MSFSLSLSLSLSVHSLSLCLSLTLQWERIVIKVRSQRCQRIGRRGLQQLHKARQTDARQWHRTCRVQCTGHVRPRHRRTEDIKHTRDERPLLMCGSHYHIRHVLYRRQRDAFVHQWHSLRDDDLSKDRQEKRKTGTPAAAHSPTTAL